MHCVRGNKCAEKWYMGVKMKGKNRKDFEPMQRTLDLIYKSLWTINTLLFVFFIKGE